jgi:putative nucleotidyltransferase with HDIG domain
MSAAAPKTTSNRRLLLISDRVDESRDIATILSAFGEVTTISAADIPDRPADGIAGVIVEMDLRSAANVQAVRNRLLHKSYQPLPRLFVLSEALHHGSMQAWALGATDTIARPFDARGLQQRIRGSFPELPAEETGTAGERALSKGIAAAHLVMAKIFDRLPLGIPLTFSDVLQAETQIIKAIKRTSLREWLAMVGKHHNSSYRHCLFAAGSAVAFAQHLGMREDDQRRLTRAALLHDVGKAFIPLSILDKPSALTDDERAVMQTHAKLGYDSLAAEGSFPPEMLDVVLHHHEYLDGTGYPDGLAGDEISDIVRIITIADIHTALVEKRVYRAPMTHMQAFAVLESMQGKLDAHLLQAFRPVVLGM